MILLVMRRFFGLELCQKSLSTYGELVILLKVVFN